MFREEILCILKSRAEETFLCFLLNTFSQHDVCSPATNRELHFGVIPGVFPPKTATFITPINYELSNISHDKPFQTYATVYEHIVMKHYYTMLCFYSTYVKGKFDISVIILTF